MDVLVCRLVWLCIGGIKEHFRFDTDPVSLWFKPSSRAVSWASRGGKGHRGNRYYLSRGDRIVECCGLLGGGEWPEWGKFKFETRWRKTRCPLPLPPAGMVTTYALH